MSHLGQNGASYDFSDWSVTAVLAYLRLLVLDFYTWGLILPLLGLLIALESLHKIHEAFKGLTECLWGLLEPLVAHKSLRRTKFGH